MSKATDSIVTERRRQQDKGFTATHDDSLTDGSLAKCAVRILDHLPGSDWDGWTITRAEHVVTKRNYRESLVVAASMIIAEIERCDRRTADGHESFIE